jgi:predicted alpha/beta hydrolase
MKTSMCITAAFAVWVSSSIVHAGQRDLDLKAPDGTTLKATYFAAAKPGPGIVLLHMCNSQRKAWAGLAETLAAQGFHAIALDYRGMARAAARRSTRSRPPSGSARPSTGPATSMRRSIS